MAGGRRRYGRVRKVWAVTSERRKDRLPVTTSWNERMKASNARVKVLGEFEAIRS
jgi:hypothetical protein